MIKKNYVSYFTLFRLQIDNFCIVFYLGGVQTGG